MKTQEESEIAGALRIAFSICIASAYQAATQGFNLAHGLEASPSNAARKVIEKRAQEKRASANNACIEYVEPLRREYSFLEGANEKRGIADALKFLMKLTEWAP